MRLEWDFRLSNDGTYFYEYDDEGDREGRQRQCDEGGRVHLRRFNRKIGKEVDTTSPFDMQDAAIERYVYEDGRNGIASLDGGDVVFDFVDADGPGGSGAMTLEKRYFRGNRVDELFAQEDVTKSLTATDRVLWQVVDHLSTVRALVDQDGNAVTKFVYDAFGGIVSGDTSLTRYLFTSREFDVDTGLQYNRARWYDAGVGRWISEDPLGFAAGDANTARYVGNGVVGSLDPSGLEEKERGTRERPEKDTDFFRGDHAPVLSRFRRIWRASSPHNPSLRYEVAEWIIRTEDPATGKPEYDFDRWPWKAEWGPRNYKWEGPPPENSITFVHTHPFPGKQKPSENDYTAVATYGRAIFIVTQDYILKLYPPNEEDKARKDGEHTNRITYIERTDRDRKKIYEYDVRNR